ncbi:MAG: tRNA 2-selenouridine(34) synthase MnmH [Peptoniphilaceae bacterium]
MKFEIEMKDVLEYINKNERYIFVDMRSPKEFKDFRIPKSINLPILNDNERAIVGKEFSNGSIDEAKYLGVVFASKSLPEFYKKFYDLTKEYDHVILYCSRGGYRSTVIYKLLRSLNLPVKKLIGGYKSYRKYIRENLYNLASSKNFIVLDGKTGVGKTEILKKLKAQNYSILNLEELANHRGSSFGSVGLSPQPSQKMFESLIFNEILNSNSTIITEGESIKIGSLKIPKDVYDCINKGRRIVISDTIKNRVDRIKSEYLNSNEDEIYLSLEKLSKFISYKKYNLYKNKLKDKDYNFIVEDLIRNYYDPHYKINYSKSDLHFEHNELTVEKILNSLN